jgi:hypothetical protein
MAQKGRERSCPSLFQAPPRVSDTLGLRQISCLYSLSASYSKRNRHLIAEKAEPLQMRSQEMPEREIEDANADGQN